MMLNFAKVSAREFDDEFEAWQSCWSEVVQGAMTERLIDNRELDLIVLGGGRRYRDTFSTHRVHGFYPGSYSVTGDDGVV